MVKGGKANQSHQIKSNQIHLDVTNAAAAAITPTISTTLFMLGLC
jgi:hypothetical protein